MLWLRYVAAACCLPRAHVSASVPQLGERARRASGCARATPTRPVPVGSIGCLVSRRSADRT